MKNFFTLAALLLCSWQVYGQNNVFGNVIDEEGNPLPGASVLILESELGTTTDSDGFFMLRNLAGGEHTIQVDYLGYEGQKKKVSVVAPTSIDFILTSTAFDLGRVEVLGTWAKATTPVTQTNVTRDELEKLNQGQDIPYLLRMTPSLITTSDAGTGIGYTGMRIRGSDPTRINVTVNGIPINDAESQAVFWVNMPDFASSTDNIQVQRGVGTSTNGAGAFGATVNLQSNGLREKAYGTFSNSFGSFNTRKHNLQLGTGLINDHWAFDGRLSMVQSDGYVDRGAADLKSYYLSGGWYGDKTVVKAITFAGKEVTYQSWYGTPESRITGDEAGMRTHAANNGYSEAQLANLLNSGRTYNFYLYDNQVDNYQQDHYQLHWTQQFSSEWTWRTALHYTRGRGYFEQFREDDDFADYNLTCPVIGADTICSGDFIRRRWLDNDFYGITGNLNYQFGPLDFTLGGAFHQYEGDHFGEIIWAEFAQGLDIRNRYYDNVGKKGDFNVFAKAEYQINEKLRLFGDVQMRRVDYTTVGIDSDLRAIDIEADYTFFNPKFGARYHFNQKQSLYFNLGVANREPDRNDFVDAPIGVAPRPERLTDFELGYQYQTKNLVFEANAYYMTYKNQLVLTGALNDVGSSLRTNVDQSYRAGIELQGAWDIVENLNWNANLALSQNKINNFTEVVYDYTNDFDIIETTFSNTDIAFSPNIVAASQLTFHPTRALELALLTKYVGAQFLDNTSDPGRQIDPYLVNDLRLAYRLQPKRMEAINISLTINNLFNEQYSANGYTYNYIFGDKIVENFYYPQAGTWWLAGVDLKF